MYVANLTTNHYINKHMSINSRKTWLAVGATAMLASGAPGLVAPGMMTMAVAQNSQKITGTVVDEFGDPVIGANIRVKGSNAGAITDPDGKFSVEAKSGATLEVSFIGFATQTVTAAPGMKVTLKEDAQSLDDVVVVGYGVQKKKLITGATIEVKGDAIQKLSTTQVLGALQSQTPGVNIQANSGQPGDGFKIAIRGAGTNGDTKPLYVIDGVSGGDINNLNPADIERVDVLKDAASCAIYGSAAANGVILVTTKQGKAGKVQVSYDGNVGWANIYRLPQMLTAKEYMKVMDLVRIQSGETPYDWSKFVSEDLLSAYNDGSNPGTNWVEALRNKNAVTTSHSFNVAGGSDRSTFSLGLGYQYQDGVFGGDLAKSDFSRFTLRANSEHILYRNSEGLDVVKFGENLYYNHKQNQGIQIGNQYSNELSNMLRANPLIPIYNKDGEYFGYDDLKEMGMFNFTSYASNPILSLVKNQSANNESRSYGLNATAYLEVQPIKGLVYRGQFNYNQSSWSWRAYLPTYHINDQGAQRTTDQATNQVGLGWGWSNTHTLNYKFDLGQNNFDILAGMEYGQSKPEYGFSLNASSSNATVADLKHAYMGLMKNRKGQATVDGSPYGDSKGLSFFGRVNYNYDEKYMLTAIFRGDGSSVFAPGHRWGYFPSFSAGWVVSNEKFMESVENWMDFLKVRAGWGQNGNKNVSAFQYEAAFGFNDFSSYSFNNTKDQPTAGASLIRLANEDLTWETSEQINIGLDARFINSKLGVNLDWYRKTTKDLLLAVPVSPTTGFSSMMKNAGTVRNQGVEAAINWNDRIGNDFQYNISYNIAYNKNEVTKVNSPQKYNNGGSDLLAQGTGYMSRFEEGEPIGYFWGYKTDGVIQNEADLKNYISTLKGNDPANSHQGENLKVGDLKFVDYNGDGVVNDADKTNLGDPTPDVTMGITLGASYKGFDINITGFAALGQQVARSYRKFTDGEYENYTSDVFSYWTGEGTSNKYPQLAHMNNGANWQSISDLYIEDAGYFRLQNLTVGYDFKRLMKHWAIQQCRLYFAAQNLFTITDYKGMDPENGMALSGDKWVTGVDVGNYPQPRTYMIGVNVKF